MTLTAKISSLADNVSLLNSQIKETNDAIDASEEKMSGVIELTRRLRTELASAANTVASANSLRSGVGASNSTASNGGTKTMLTAELDALARALKPVLDKIDRRQM